MSLQSQLCRAKEHKKTTITIFILLIVLPIIIIHFLFKWKSHCYWIEAEWSAGDVLGYFGDVLSFVGAVVLGYVAITQTEKAYQLNTELLRLEKNNNKPCFDIVPSQLYKIFLAEDMQKKLDEVDIYTMMLIKVLYPYSPRTGLETRSALIELEVTNSGYVDIRRIFVQKTLFYLWVCDPYNSEDEKIVIMTGDTHLKVGEKRKLYIDVSREISKDFELDNSCYTNNINKLMPHIEFELTLETITGDLYKEVISCGSGWDVTMKNNNNTATRSIGIINVNVSETKQE